MSDGYYFSLRINGKQDIYEDIIPLSLAQIAGFLLEFSRLLGHKNQVRFKSIEKGSLLAVAEVSDPNTKHSVEERISFAQSWQLSDESKTRVPVEVAAYDRLNMMLEKDQLSASIGCGDSLEATSYHTLLELGQREEWEPIYLFQPGVLDGSVIRIGNSPDTHDVPVHLENWSGERYLCRAEREMAFTMGSYPLGTFVRVHGSGEWSKDPRRPWRVKHFMIDRYELLPLQKGFRAAIERLRETGLARKLSQMEDPEGYLNSLQEGRTD